MPKCGGINQEILWLIPLIIHGDDLLKDGDEEMIVRDAEERDLESIRDIASSYGNLGSWPGRPDYLDHELTSGALAVCEDGGEVAGFGGVVPRGPVVHLADLFVRPDRLGKGIGKALLTEILPSEGERITFASSDPRALPLYVRFGMSPMAPLLYLTGNSQATRRLPDWGVTLVEAEPAALTDHDRTASGRDRNQDLEFLQRAGGHCFLALHGKTVVGYGFCRLVEATEGVQSEAFLGPVGAPDAVDAASTALALLGWAAGQAGEMTLPVFGPNRVLPVLLEAGFRIHDMDTFMASKEGLLDLQRYFPSAELG